MNDPKKMKTMISFFSYVIGLVLVSSCSVGCSSSNGEGQPLPEPVTPIQNTYQNPVIATSLPDPTIIKGQDGHYYLYATEDIRNLPIYQSDDLINWKYMGTAFTDQTRPQWNPEGGIWAPDINYFDGHYVLYYSKSVWGGEWTCGVGVATAQQPQGPFTDHGALFTSEQINVRNSIDPFFIEEDGHKYLFWGSFHGIYGIELTSDGLAIMPGATPIQVAADQMEATYIHKRGDYYYLFGSNGSCCEGAQSTYQVVYGRSTNLFGPYLTKNGQRMLDGNYDVLLHGSDRVAGPGHNAEFITDNSGQDWMIYHGFLKADADAGRQVFIDRLEWYDGWPQVAGSQSSVEGRYPVL